MLYHIIINSLPVNTREFSGACAHWQVRIRVRFIRDYARVDTILKKKGSVQYVTKPPSGILINNSLRRTTLISQSLAGQATEDTYPAKCIYGSVVLIISGGNPSVACLIIVL